MIPTWMYRQPKAVTHAAFLPAEWTLCDGHGAKLAREMGLEVIATPPWMTVAILLMEPRP